MSDDNFMFATESKFDSSENDIPDVLTDKYLIFISDGLMFGVSTEHVLEIITNHVITHLPMVPDYVRGIINLRGLIIPILDIRLRLGKAACDSDCIVVVSVDGVQLGILVDTVDQMVDIPRGDLSAVPAQNSQELVSGMCSLSGGSTMLVLDCTQLLHL